MCMDSVLCQTARLREGKKFELLHRSEVKSTRGKGGNNGRKLRRDGSVSSRCWNTRPATVEEKETRIIEFIGGEEDRRRRKSIPIFSCGFGLG